MAVMLAACSSAEDAPSVVDIDVGPPSVVTVVEGLINPLGLALLPDGGVLVAEEGTGENDDSAGVSVITPEGAVGRVVSGLPSSVDSGDLSGVPLVGVSPDGSTAYTAHFNSQSLLTFPIPPEGLQPSTKTSPPLGPEDLGRTMVPLLEVRLVNPFDIAFDANDVPVVSDASDNGVATMTPQERTVFIHRFGDLTDPQRESMKVDAVPTGIARVDDEYYVTLFSGCPYPAGSGKVVAVGAERSERTIVDGLSLPIDVAVGPDGEIWILEFARFIPDASCFDAEGYEPGSGTLSRLRPDGTLEQVLTGLDFPGSVLPMPDGSLYITEVFGGRVLHATWPEDGESGAGAVTDVAEEWRFVEVSESAGLDFHHGAFANDLSMDPAAMMGAGLCWIDYDSDGWLDLYLVNSHSTDEVEYWSSKGGLPQNQLFRNDEGVFTNVSEATGTDLVMRGNGCVTADFNGDGWSDIYVTADGPNALLLNDAGTSFTDVAVSAGVAVSEWNSAAVVADLNLDGLPDLFVGSYIDLARKIEKPSGAFPQDYVGIPDRLFINDGPRELHFSEVTRDAGLDLDERALGALFSDFDGDGDLDLSIANDGQPNRLHRNDSDRTSGTVVFTDVTESAGTGDSGSGMGVAGGDYDADGRFDFIVTNWETELNALYRNTSTAGEMTFDYMTYRMGISGLGNNKTSWGVGWGDFDNDTDLDFVIAHGRVPISDFATDAELIRLYGNMLAEGSPGRFQDWTRTVGFEDVGPRMARGSAIADFDNDGDLDIAVNTIAGDAVLLRNDDPPGRSITVELGGSHIGAVVSVELADGTTLQREGHAGSSYLAGEDPRFHFGLGDVDGAVDVTVRWPDGTTTVASDVADTFFRIER
ncbi:MAG: ScyD/ScyE family protein [Actinomycetota bacterium]